MGRPMGQKPLGFIDVETTGLAEWEGHEPIEVALIVEPVPGTRLIQEPPQNGPVCTSFEGLHTPYPYRVVTETELRVEGLGPGEGLVDRFSYQSKIKPQHIEKAEPKALEINGYADHPEDWEDAPTFDQIADDLNGCIQHCILVGHNVSFDVRFLRAAMLRAEATPRFGYHLIDTVTLAIEHLMPCGIERVNMDTIRPFLAFEAEGSHTAMKDVEDARRLYHMLSRATWWDRFRWRYLRRQAR